MKDEHESYLFHSVQHYTIQTEMIIAMMISIQSKNEYTQYLTG